MRNKQFYLKGIADHKFGVYVGRNLLFVVDYKITWEELLKMIHERKIS
jgi:hypothetical protein